MAKFAKVMKKAGVEPTHEGGIDPPTACRYCKHLNWTPFSKADVESTRLDADTIYTCEAFQQGIPSALYAGATHAEPIEGDSGITFAQSDDAPPHPWK